MDNSQHLPAAAMVLFFFCMVFSLGGAKTPYAG
jgi:hypothetical protein